MLDAINDGEVEYPERMTFMQWLAWRKSTGTRPLKKKDGGSSSLEEENKLWKEVMEFLHDAGEEELEEEEEEEDEEEEAEEPAPPPDQLPPEDERVELSSLELEPDEAHASAALAASCGRSTESGSERGPSPRCAESLQKELRELYRPDQEPVADYLTRLARELDKLTTKATLLSEEFGKLGVDWHPTRIVRALRTRFSGEAEDATETEKEVQALGELIQAERQARQGLELAV